MLTWEKISDPQLDIVGIVAVLGEGSTTRNAQASALGWHHVLPRLLPAPQALLKHGREKRLPTVPGTVVGAYSGNVSFELNFFCQLLHDDNLGKNQVELVEVGHNYALRRDTLYSSIKGWFHKRQHKACEGAKAGDTPFFGPYEQAYDVKPIGSLVMLSVVGCCSSIGMLAGALICEDGFAFMATLLLSLTSAIVGAASWWKLDFKEDPPKRSQKDRQEAIPDSDVVIFYPRQGAFRIVRCSENIAKLYLRTESCCYVFGDNWYRILALIASILLMAGLLCMSNSKIIMQVAFAMTYISLNALYWLSSAINSTGAWGHWKHKYICTTKAVMLPSAAPTPAIPKRFNTTESFMNIPVRTQEPISPTGIDRQTTFPPTPTNLEVPPSEPVADASQGPTVPGNVRQRKVTFHEISQVPTRVPLGLNIIQTKWPSQNHNGSPITQSPILASPTSVLSSGGIGRQNSVDLEGLKARHLNVLGSTKDAWRRWVDKPKVDPKRKQHATEDDTSKSETFTTALWKAIAVTGNTRWLSQTHIAPDNEVWTLWIAEAGKRAKIRENDKGELVAAYTIDDENRIVLPPWDYQGRLSSLFVQEPDLYKRRPQKALKLIEVVTELRNRREKVRGIAPSIESKLRQQAKNAKFRARQDRLRRATNPTIRQSSLMPPASVNMTTVSRDFARRKSNIH